MSDVSAEKAKLLTRVRRIRGQVEGLEHLLEADKGCFAVLQQIAAVRGAMNGLMNEVIEDHVHAHIAGPATISDAERARGAEELLEVVRAYLK